MNFNAVVSAIGSEKDFIYGKYFEDPLNYMDSKCCAIGALIKNLPENLRQEAISIINGDRNDVFRPINEDKIRSSSLLRLVGILISHYKCSEEFLTFVQIVNDTYIDDIKEKVLSYIEVERSFRSSAFR